MSQSKIVVSIFIVALLLERLVFTNLYASFEGPRQRLHSVPHSDWLDRLGQMLCCADLALIAFIMGVREHTRARE